jgi:hypothetical protein
LQSQSSQDQNSGKCRLFMRFPPQSLTLLMSVARQIQLYPQDKAFLKLSNRSKPDRQATGLAPPLGNAGTPPSLQHRREYLGNRPTMEIDYESCY